MSGDPKGPARGGDTIRERGVQQKTRPKVERPPRFKVVLYNDDFTPMGFVVGVLEIVFDKSPAESNALMLRIHRSGSGIAGVYPLEIAETKTSTVHRMAEERGYPLEIAETKTSTVHRMAEERGYPLRAGVEPE